MYISTFALAARLYPMYVSATAVDCCSFFRAKIKDAKKSDLHMEFVLRIFYRMEDQVWQRSDTNPKRLPLRNGKLRCLLSKARLTLTQSVRRRLGSRSIIAAQAVWRYGDGST